MARVNNASMVYDLIKGRMYSCANVNEKQIYSLYDFSFILSLCIISSFFIVPAGLDPPQIISIGSRECTIEISPPIRPNGNIIRYLAYFDAVLRNETKFTVVQIYGLQPYTSYQVHVAACTKVGCVNSTAISFSTYEEGNIALKVFYKVYDVILVVQ